MIYLKKYFPSDRISWKKYSKVFWPIVLASMLFTADGLVGNFMVGYIPEGTSALAAINSWSNVIIGIFVGTAATGSILMAQHYYSHDYKVVKEIARLRNLLTISVSLIFISWAWIAPDSMTSFFLKGNKQDPAYAIASKEAHEYLKVITINWFLIALTFNLGNMYRETGYGKVTLFWGIFGLITSIIINSILLYVFKTGVQGAAWGTVGGRAVVLIIGITILYKKKIAFAFKPWTIFQTSKKTWISFWKRWYIFVGFASMIFFINFRSYFWDLGYPIKSDSTLGQGIGAMTILGISGAIKNIFTTAFASLGAMAAIFVGSELGKKNYTLAKKHADEIRGYTTTMAAILSVFLLVFGSFLPLMTFFSDSQNSHVIIDHQAHLKQARDVLYVVAFWYPIWIWFMCTYRCASSGGKGFWFALTNWVVTGPIQIAWVAVLMIVIVPNSTFFADNFWVSYFVFFLVDIIEIVAQEILYHKIDWQHSIL